MSSVAARGGPRPASMSSERGELWERLTLVGRVLKLQQIVTWTVRLLIAGLVLDCLWLLGSRVSPYIVPTAILPAIPLALAALGALVLAFWRPSMSLLARHADRQLGLKERLTTAVELQGGRRGLGEADRGSASQAREMLAALQLSDAVAAFRRFEPIEAFPIRASYRELGVLLGLSLAAMTLVLVPNPMQQVARQREQVQQTIRQEAERLNRQADELAALNAEDPSDELQQIEQALREGARALDQRSMSGEEALAALSALEQRLQALQAQGSADLEEALSSLAGSLAQDPATRQLSTSLAKGDYQQAAEDMRRLADQIDNMSPEERRRLARALRQAGQRTARSNPGLSQGMMQAANGLEQDNMSEAQQGMQSAAGQMDRASGQLRAGSQRERAMSQSQQSRSAISRSMQQAQGRGQQQAGGRQAGSQAGSQGENGEDGMGQGQNPGQGQGDGDQSGGDRPGGSAAGTGTNPNRSEEVYDPAFASSRQEHVGSNQPFQPNSAYESPNPEEGYQNDAQVGYRQVYPRYQEKAVQSLQNSYIPIGLKDLVKDYFSSIQPSSR